MPTVATNSLAAIERTGAQQIANGVASAIDQVVLLRNSAASPGEVDGFAAAPRALTEIVQLATAIVDGLARQPKEEAEQSAKVLGVIAAVILVVVAVVVTAFTFGAGAALVALAVIAASAIVGAATAASGIGQGASLLANSVLGGQLATLFGPVKAAAQTFHVERQQNPAGARDRVLDEVAKALRELQRLSPQTERLKGPCAGHPPASYVTLQRVTEAMAKLIAALRQGQTTGGDGRASLTALDAFHAALVKAVQSLRPLGPPRN